MTGKYPCLVTPDGTLNESYAIAKYLAHGHATLLGSSNEERAKVDQWALWGYTTFVPGMMKAVQAVHGWAEISQADFTTALNAIKQNAKDLNTNLKGKTWIVGDNVTLADLVLATQFIIPMQTLLDAGFRKAMPDFGAWFDRCVALPEFIAVCGHIKSCSKSIKPQIKAEPKKEEKKAAAPKAAAKNL